MSNAELMAGFIGNLVNGTLHDERHSYNPPAVDRPTMTDAQFVYDNQREIEVGILANPAVLAQQFMIMRDRIAELESAIERLSVRVETGL